MPPEDEFGQRPVESDELFGYLVKNLANVAKESSNTTASIFSFTQPELQLDLWASSPPKDCTDADKIYRFFSISASDYCTAESFLAFIKYLENLPDKIDPNTNNNLLVQLFQDNHGCSFAKLAEICQWSVNDRYKHLLGSTKSLVDRPGSNVATLAKNFSRVYDPELQLLDCFTADLVQIAHLWEPSKYIAPYTAIVQSSGFGKSRLACEYGRQKGFTLFICLRDGNSTGFPLRSAIADDILNTRVLYEMSDRIRPNIRQTIYYITFIAACLWHLDEWLEDGGAGKSKENHKSPADFIEPQLSTEGNQSGVAFWSAVREKWTLLFHRSISVLPNTESSSDHSYIMPNKESSSESSSYPALLQSVCLLEGFAGRIRVRKLDFPVLFALDEAKPLSAQCLSKNYLHYFRVAMNHIPSAIKSENQPGVAVFVMLDTFGNLLNFLPDKIIDPSLRYITGRNLFSPFCTFGFPVVTEGQVDYESSHSSVLKFHGRYLWRTIKETSLVQTAAAKLICAEPENVKEATEAQLLALLGPRLGIFLQSDEAMSMQLVASHCATLLYTENDRKLLFTAYPSEPVLAEASATLSLKYNAFSWLKLLKQLFRSVRLGLVDAGTRGELASRVMLLMAMDRARIPSAQPQASYSSQSYSNTNVQSPEPIFHRPISMREFLVNFGGMQLVKSLFGANSVSDHLRSGEVNFTHFMYVTYTPSVAQAHLFFRRYIAVFCRRNESVIDLLIPYRWLQARKKKVKPQWRYSYILLQVKNYDTKSGDGTGVLSEQAVLNRASLELKIAPTEDIIYIYHQVGYNQTANISKLTGFISKDRKIHAAMVKGISATTQPFIRQDEESILQDLSLAWMDPRALYMTGGAEFKPTLLAALHSTLTLCYPLELVQGDIENIVAKDETKAKLAKDLTLMISGQ